MQFRLMLGSLGLPQVCCWERRGGKTCPSSRFSELSGQIGWSWRCFHKADKAFPRTPPKKHKRITGGDLMPSLKKGTVCVWNEGQSFTRELLPGGEQFCGDVKQQKHLIIHDLWKSSSASRDANAGDVGAFRLRSLFDRFLSTEVLTEFVRKNKNLTVWVGFN